MSKSWKGSTRTWRRLRAIVLQRDEYKCKIRGPKCVGKATTVDHIVTKADGGSDMLTNLRAACGPCNSSRGATAMDPEPLGRW